MKNTLFVFGLTTFTIAFGGCLKTRAQMKNEEAGYNGPGVPTKTKEVQGSYQVDEFRQEITRLTGKIEELEHNQQETAKRNDKLQSETLKKLEARINDLEAAQLESIEAIKKLQANIPPPDQTALVDDARKALNNGDTNAALEKLNQYLRNPGGKRAEEATFLRGEAYFARQDFQKALLDYTKFPEKFNKSKLMPQALYKIGMSFSALDLKDDATAFFSELIDKYPQSKEAGLAKAKLAKSKKKKKS